MNTIDLNFVCKRVHSLCPRKTLMLNTHTSIAEYYLFFSFSGIMYAMCVYMCDYSIFFTFDGITIEPKRSVAPNSLSKSINSSHFFSPHHHHHQRHHLHRICAQYNCIWMYKFCLLCERVTFSIFLLAYKNRTPICINRVCHSSVKFTTSSTIGSVDNNRTKGWKKNNTK